MIIYNYLAYVNYFTYFDYINVFDECLIVKRMYLWIKVKGTSCQRQDHGGSNKG